ncbi:MAG: PDZ domain-containing protein [Phycisphaerae bacterium]|nr:PDZ domain-containing protein [Phycisphaerae bacterium]
MNEQRQVLQTAGVALALFGLLVWCRGCPAAALAGATPSGHLVVDQKSATPTGSEQLNFRSAVAMLASDRWSVRSRAQSFLMLESPSRLPAVLHDLRRARSAEQANRLLKVALQLYLMAQTPVLGGPVPFLGVQYAMEPVTVRLRGRHTVCEAALVMGVLPGFPAAAALHTTDLIIGINGRIFPLWTTANDFRRQIQALKPGDVVRLRVLRGIAVMSLAVRLVGVGQDAGQLGAMLLRRQAAAAEFIAQDGR